MDAILNGPGGATALGATGVTLGRTPENQVVVNDGKASSRHAEIRPSGQGFTITDLGSTNGTFVNGQQLTAHTPRMLMPGDTIRIGDTSYNYQVQNYQPGMYAAPVVPSAQPSNYDPTQLAPAPQQPFQSTVYGGPANYQPTMPAQPDSNYQPTMQAYPQYDQQYNQPYTPNPQQQGFTPPPPPPGPGQSGQSFYDQNNALTQQASYLSGSPGVPSSPYNANQPYTPGMSSGTPSYPNNQSSPNNMAPSYQMQGGYVPGPPQGPGKRKRNPALTIALVIVALLVVIGAASAFFVTRNQQITKDNNAHSTATAVASNATQAANTQATSAAVANITATAGAQNANPYVSGGGGTLALEDALKDNSGGHSWEEDSNCKFTQSVYEVTESQSNTFFTCDAKSTRYSNIAFDVALKIIQGDCAGIAFRANVSNDAEYFFEMCQSGTYDLVMYDGTNAKYLINVANSSAIKSGTGQINTLGVVANGSTIQLFINGTSVDQTTDSTYTSGSIGLLAVNHNSSSTSVAYAGVRVWTL